MAIKKYINTADVVELSGRSTSEVQELAKTGVLPAQKNTGNTGTDTVLKTKPFG